MSAYLLIVKITWHVWIFQILVTPSSKSALMKNDVHYYQEIDRDIPNGSLLNHISGACHNHHPNDAILFFYPSTVQYLHYKCVHYSCLSVHPCAVQNLHKKPETGDCQHVEEGCSEMLEKEDALDMYTVHYPRYDSYVVVGFADLRMQMKVVGNGMVVFGSLGLAALVGYKFEDYTIELD